MPPIDRSDKAHAAMALRGRLLLVAFGLGILAFLVAIDRPEWFHIRPASGGAAAMSLGANG